MVCCSNFYIMGYVWKVLKVLVRASYTKKKSVKNMLQKKFGLSNNPLLQNILFRMFWQPHAKECLLLILSARQKWGRLDIPKNSTLMSESAKSPLLQNWQYIHYVLYYQHLHFQTMCTHFKAQICRHRFLHSQWNGRLGQNMPWFSFLLYKKQIGFCHAVI